jgi:hypothetical protein
MISLSRDAGVRSRTDVMERRRGERGSLKKTNTIDTGFALSAAKSYLLGIEMRQCKGKCEIKM